MATNKHYTVPYRRKREGVTDYVKRRRLLLSGQSRLVVRRYLSNFTVQFVCYSPQGDVTVWSASAQELAKSFGLLGHKGSLPVAYLVGYLAGKKAIKAGHKNAIADFGRLRAQTGSSLFAAVKGTLDAGVHIPCSTDALPSLERVQGKIIASYATSLLHSDKDKYQKQFSGYLRGGVAVDKLPTHLHEVKEKIDIKWQ